MDDRLVRSLIERGCWYQHGLRTIMVTRKPKGKIRKARRGRPGRKGGGR